MDGPGIRTIVFLKGCNMSCFWCHNPESIDPCADIFYYSDKCIRCGGCISACSDGCHFYAENGEHIFDRKKCKRCGSCVDVCFAEALIKAGKEVPIDVVMEEIEKDIEFYEISGGGMTLSGGEPLLQAEASHEVLKRCKEREIGTAIDTSGNVNWSAFELVLPLTDYVLYDLKSLDEERHRRLCGTGNKRIIENLERLQDYDTEIILRVPVIPGINDKEEDIEAIFRFSKKLENIQRIELLPFHKICEVKYRALGKGYKARDLQPVSGERLSRLKEICRL